MNHKKKKEKYKLETALKKLEKEENKIQRQFDKFDNRTNVYLSISLGLFSLQITLLTNTIINTYEKYFTEHETIMIIIFILFLINVIFNLNSIMNFRRSSKISEKNYSNKDKINDFVNNNLNENLLIKQEYFKFLKNSIENDSNIILKETYINKGLNSIIISIILIVPILFSLVLVVKIIG